MEIKAGQNKIIRTFAGENTDLYTLKTYITAKPQSQILLSHVGLSGRAEGINICLR